MQCLRLLRTGVVFTLVALAWTAIASGESSEEAQSDSASTSVAAGVYSEAQLDDGQATYEQHCASCHSSNLGGSASAPPLKGVGFDFFWEGRDLGELFTYLKSEMPASAPGTLSDEQYAAVMAVILNANGHPLGESALPTEPDALSKFTYVAPEE